MVKKFLDFIKEDYDFYADNPHGDWLKQKQERVNKKIKEYEGKGSYGKGLTGDVTGSIRGAKIPIHHLKDLKGAEDEHKFAQSALEMHKFDKKIGGKENFDTKTRPVLIGVNHKGETHVLEGNHRIAYAHKHNIPHIHTEINYFNGGEEAEGKFHPEKVKKMHEE
jgi:hypothetical protein